jgi:hypothetical protein
LFPLQKIIVSGFVLFLSVNGYAGDPYCRITGARETGMANVFNIHTDTWSGFSNQANLAFNESLSFGFNYENRFGIPELGTRSAGAVFPAGRLSIAGAYSYFGFSDFRREMIGLACGMPLSEMIAAGVQIDYFSEKTTGEYDNNQSVTCEAGIIISTSESVKIGLHLFNPVPNSIRRTDMPAGLKAGVALNLNKEFSAGFETGIRTGEKLFIRTGFEYLVVEKFRVRAGFSSENNSFCFGFGYRFKPITMDFGFATHDRLGITSSVSMIITIK